MSVLDSTEQSAQPGDDPRTTGRKLSRRGFLRALATTSAGTAAGLVALGAAPDPALAAPPRIPTRTPTLSLIHI